MKSIAYQDILGGSIHVFKDVENPKQTRWERYFKALEELKHVGDIKIFRYERGKLKLLKIQRK